MEEQRNKAEKSKSEAKKSSIRSELVKDKADQKTLESTIDRLRKEADTLAQRAQDERKFSLIEESNDMRKRCFDHMNQLEERKVKIAKLEDHLNEL